MTPEEIKKIAEEYIAYKYPKSYKEMKPYALKNAIKVISEMIEYFTERYCVVERSKVVEMYPHYDNFNTFNRGVCYCLRILFGPDIRKEEEDAEDKVQRTPAL